MNIFYCLDVEMFLNQYYNELTDKTCSWCPGYQLTINYRLNKIPIIIFIYIGSLTGTNTCYIIALIMNSILFVIKSFVIVQLLILKKFFRCLAKEWLDWQYVYKYTNDFLTRFKMFNDTIIHHQLWSYTPNRI